MPYNESLDTQIAHTVENWGLTRKKMFGGTCYLLRGNMLCGVYKDFLIVRLGDKEGAKALEEPFVAPFDITGRPMKGWVMIEERYLNSEQLGSWLDRAKAFVETLLLKPENCS